jgi:hypothetical protein
MAPFYSDVTTVCWAIRPRDTHATKVFFADGKLDAGESLFEFDAQVGRNQLSAGISS